MKRALSMMVLFTLIGLHLACGREAVEEELPDDYLPFTLKLVDGQLIGESEFLEGFTISMNIADHRRI